jgi:hypothetical protein
MRLAEERGDSLPKAKQRMTPLRATASGRLRVAERQRLPKCMTWRAAVAKQWELVRSNAERAFVPWPCKRSVQHQG